MHVFEPSINEVLNNDFKLKGNWNNVFFKNNNPITLELGCGKGEYSVALAEKYPNRNFIGIDIKGARMWQGAKISNEKELKNIAFLRTKIELINLCFFTNEISRIWLTFPDPQIKNKQTKNRLTSPKFLNIYKQFLISGGIIHLKTDNDLLYDYTKKIIEFNKLELLYSTNNLYKNENNEEILSIKTYYENIFLEQGKNINYLSFKLLSRNKIEEPTK